MSVHLRDDARHCDGCERFVKGVHQCRWQVVTGIGEDVTQTFDLCVRCRTDVRDFLRRLALRVTA